MKRLIPVVLLALVAVPSAAKKPKVEEPAVQVDPVAQAQAKYRHQVMEGVGKHMKATGMIIKAQVDRPQDLVWHAQAIHDASLFLPSMFPAGSGPDKVQTDALASVWEQPEAFAQKAQTLQVESGKLLDLAKQGDVPGFKAQFGNVGKSCGGCHDDFLKEDED